MASHGALPGILFGVLLSRVGNGQIRRRGNVVKLLLCCVLKGVVVVNIRAGALAASIDSKLPAS